MTLDAPSATAKSAPMAFQILGRVVSSDITLRGIPCAFEGADPVIELIGSGFAQKRHPEWPPFVQFEDAAGLHFHARDIGEFHISADGATVSYSLAPLADNADVQYLLTGPVISLALQQQGEVLIHGAAVAHGCRAFAFAGPHATGKSTLAAAFSAVGATLLTDDVLPLRIAASQVMARRSVPWIKLKEDSLQAVGHDLSGLNLVWSLAEKRKVPMKRAAIEGAEFGLAAIYLLDPRNDVDCKVKVTPLLNSEAVGGILANTYAAESLRGNRAARALDAASRIAETVPVRTISYHRSYENLPAIRDAILRDVEGLPNA